MDPKKSRIASGVALIALGILLYWLDRSENVGQAVVFFAVGSLFLGAYLYGRNYGLLIPACLMLGLGSGTVLGRWDVVAEPWQVGLGVGFIGIWLVALLYERRAHWWPLIPGVILLVSAFQMGKSVMRFLFSGGWPLLLIVVGVFVLLGAFGKDKKGPR